jgi:hypothetical protein
MQIETLGEAYTHGVTAIVYCAWGKRDGMKSIQECVFSKRLDMATLVCTRGRDFPMALLAQRVRCPRCGSRRMRVLYDFPTKATAVPI